MKRLIAATFCLLATISVTTVVFAKGTTSRIRITGAGLQRPIEISDPEVLKNFNVWSGPGTFANDVEGTEGFIIDWASGAVTDHPNGLRTFELSFYVRYANRPFSEQTDQLAYIVSYAVDPATGQGYVYLPGKSDEPYRLNTTAIYRGREGNWFRANSAWQVAFRNIVLGNAQSSKSEVVFNSREYRAVGRSSSQSWGMTLPDRQRVKRSADTCARQPVESAVLSTDTRLPDRSEHWNYLTSVTVSPDGKLFLVGSEAGSSDSHFEDYWLFDRASSTWRYAGGGNEAKWSPDSSTILWSTPRELAPIGTIHVWVAHLMSLDVRTLQQQPLTSGVSYESDFFWCTSE